MTVVVTAAAAAAAAPSTVVAGTATPHGVALQLAERRLKLIESAANKRRPFHQLVLQRLPLLPQRHHAIFPKGVALGHESLVPRQRLERRMQPLVLRRVVDLQLPETPDGISSAPWPVNSAARLHVAPFCETQQSWSPTP